MSESGCKHKHSVAKAKGLTGNPPAQRNDQTRIGSAIGSLDSRHVTVLILRPLVESIPVFKLSFSQVPATKRGTGHRRSI